MPRSIVVLSAVALALSLAGVGLLRRSGGAQTRILRGHEWRAGREAWARCARDWDCAIVDARCGMPLSINRAHVKDYSDWLAKEFGSSSVDCERVPKEAYEAVCLEGECLARAKAAAGRM